MKRTILWKKPLVYAIIFTFVCLNVFPSSAINVSEIIIIPSIRANTLYVGGTGAGNYSKIQDAIDNASDGDTVFVFDEGSPYNELIIIDRAISLIGEDKNTTVIDANYTGSPIIITADGCLVSDFTIKNCKWAGWYWEFSSVKIFQSDFVIIKNNIITLGAYTYRGGYCFASVSLHSSSNNVIQDNYIFEEYSSSSKGCSGVVMHDSSSFNLISGNEITELDFGIYTTHSDNNVISENYIHHNDIGICSYCSNYNEIIGNNIVHNYDYGIEFSHSSINTILGNNISENGGKGCYGDFEAGIIFSFDDEDYSGSNSGSNNNYVSGNIISKNNATGIIVFDSYNNIIAKNNFFDNYGGEGYPQRWWGNAFFAHIGTRIKSFIHANTWRGNYWSDYKYGGFFPKIIRGIIELFPTYFIILWVTFDWNPAKVPYNITTTQGCYIE